MWLFASTWSAILILLIGMLLEGSWIQPMRYISHKNKIPNLLVLYLDMKLVHWLLVVIFAITLGNVGPDKPSIFHSIRHASPDRVICAVLDGVAISLGDVLIYYADALCGTALAFPIAVGLLSAVGTIFVYIVEPKGNPIFLFCGVGLALISVMFGGLATWLKEKEQAERQKALATRRKGHELSTVTIEDAPKKESMVRGVILAVIAGFIYSAWSPLGTLAARGTSH